MDGWRGMDMGGVTVGAGWKWAGFGAARGWESGKLFL